MSTRIISLLILLVAVPCWAATQVVRYIDPDAAGAGTGVDWTNAYTSMNAADNAEAKNLTVSDEYYTFYCRSSSGTADTANVNIGGAWVTDATRYIEFIGTDFPADGIYSASAYRLTLANSAGCVIVSVSYVYFRNLQFQFTTSSANTYGIYMTVGPNPCYTYVDTCIFKNVVSHTSRNYALAAFNTGGVFYVWNSTIYDSASGASSDHGAFYMSVGIMNMYNCTMYNNDSFGRINAGQDALLYNCALEDNGQGWNTNSPSVISYCISDAAQGTNAKKPVGASWANEFTNAAAGDFSLVADANSIDNGTDNPGSGLYSDDILGTARVSPWDIGAFEYAAAGSGQVMWLKMDD